MLAGEQLTMTNRGEWQLTRRKFVPVIGSMLLVSACGSTRTSHASPSADAPIIDDYEHVRELDFDPGKFAKIARVFHAQLADGKHPGAALAIYRHGKLAAQFTGGVARKAGDHPVTSNTLFSLFSTTKTWCAFAAHSLIEQGRLDLDKRVAEYWPEFAANGKENVTVGDALTHRGGFPIIEAYNTELTFAQAIEKTPLSWDPGTANGYHAVFYGSFVEELVRRIAGTDLPTFLKDNLFVPLGMSDSYLGLPAQPLIERRVAYIYLMQSRTPGATMNFGFDTKNPPIEEWKFAFNRPEVHQMVFPSGGGISTASDMARFMGMLASGGEMNDTRLLTKDTVERAVARTNARYEVDKRLRLPIPWGTGFMLGGGRLTPGFGSKSSIRTFGHYGAGCATVFGDMDRNLGVAYLTTGNRRFVPHMRRSGAVADAIFDAII